MGTFFDTPEFSESTAFDPAAISVSLFQKNYYTVARTGAYYPATVPFSFEQIPYGAAVHGGNPSVGAGNTDDSAAQHNLGAAQSNLALGQTALADKRELLGTAQDASDAAADQLADARAAYDALRMSAYYGWLKLLSAQEFGTPADVAAATVENRVNVHAVKRYEAGNLHNKQLALATAKAALADATDAVLGAAQAVENLSRSVEIAQLDLDLFHANAAAEPYSRADQYDRGPYSDTTIDPGTEDPHAYPYLPNILASNAFVSETGPGGTSVSNTQGTGQYKIGFMLTNEQYLSLHALGGANLRIDWSEITFTFQAASVPHPVPPLTSQIYVDSGTEPTLSFGDKSETMTLDDGEQLDDGTLRWRFETDVYTVDAPANTDGMQVVSVAGPMLQNVTSILTATTRGAALRRQGWSENTVGSGPVAPQRYLTLQVSNAPDAPTGANYAGSLLIEPYVEGVTGSNYLPNTDGFYREFPVAPLALIDNVADAGLGQVLANQLPHSLAPVTDGARLVDGVTRVLNTPAGLQITLSNEQTPAAIQATVEAAADLDVSTVPSPPSIPGRGWAINDCPADGDYAAKQAVKYKLSYQSAFPRFADGAPWTNNFEYLKRTTNLETGEVTNETQFVTATFYGSARYPFAPYDPSPPPPVMAGPDPSPGFTAALADVTADAEFTVLAIPGERERVEIIGASCDPQERKGFGPIRLAFAATDGG